MISRRSNSSFAEKRGVEQFLRQVSSYSGGKDELLVKVFNSSVENHVEKGRAQIEIARDCKA